MKQSSLKAGDGAPQDEKEALEHGVCTTAPIQIVGDSSGQATQGIKRRAVANG